MHFYRIESLGATFVSVSTLYHDKSIISIIFQRFPNILHSVHRRRSVFFVSFCKYKPGCKYNCHYTYKNNAADTPLGNTDGLLLVGQVGLEPTTALSTGFTVRGDTNYTVLTHMVESAGLEPATLRFSV